MWCLTVVLIVMLVQMLFAVNDEVFCVRTSTPISSGGLAGYDVCLTRIRSRVRAPPGVFFVDLLLFYDT